MKAVVATPKQAGGGRVEEVPEPDATVRRGAGPGQ